MWMLLAFEKHGERLIRKYELPTLGLQDARALWGGSDEELLTQSCPVGARQVEAISRISLQALDLESFDYVVEYDPNRLEIRQLLAGARQAISAYKGGRLSLDILVPELGTRVGRLEEAGGTAWGRQLRSLWERLDEEATAAEDSGGRRLPLIDRVVDDLDRFLARH